MKCPKCGGKYVLLERKENIMNRKIIVVNVKDKTEPGFFRVPVHRPSALGNPYPMESESDREIVIEGYRRWLWNKMKTNNPVSAELRRLSDYEGNLALACFCSPKACHAKIIKDAIEWLRKENLGLPVPPLKPLIGKVHL